ncbi:hypothetical protein BC827DRAFT_1157143 [Russula dissimulans]|nr:hypothetical protein BC827DRAFT_1157143 [Russula dissimulans]
MAHYFQAHHVTEMHGMSSDTSSVLPLHCGMRPLQCNDGMMSSDMRGQTSDSTPHSHTPLHTVHHTRWRKSGHVPHHHAQWRDSDTSRSSYTKVLVYTRGDATVATRPTTTCSSTTAMPVGAATQGCSIPHWDTWPHVLHHNAPSGATVMPADTATQGSDHMVTQRDGLHPTMIHSGTMVAIQWVAAQQPGGCNG